LSQSRPLKLSAGAGIFAVAKCRAAALHGKEFRHLLDWGAAHTRVPRRDSHVADALLGGQVLLEGRVHTIITSVFSHYDWLHLGANAATLLLFGPEALALLGARRFLSLYLSGGVVSSCCQVAWPLAAPRAVRAQYSPNQLGLGASGAINAVVAFSVLSFPSRPLLVYLVLPLPAAALGALFLGKDLVGLAMGDPAWGNPAHVGGALLGVALWSRWGRLRL
jgi:membrane associated rhomboid family serine protease